MNYCGSWRKLVGNSKSAMLAAIEVYNKPRIEYRNEIFVQLLINAWELVLKAIISRSNKSIYYPKRRNTPYRTISLTDAINRASESPLWPASIEIDSVRENLRHLELFRDNSVHFYNAKGFGVVVYSLAQTAIRNYEDLLREVFGESLADEISWELLPLGVEIPSKPLEFLAGKGPRSSQRSHAVNEFIASLRNSIGQIENEGKDTSRLLTILDVALRSVKKVASADFIVGIDGSIGGGDPIIVNQFVDPNVSHPYLVRDVIKKVVDSGTPFSGYDFQAVASVQRLRLNRQYCWIDENTNSSKWSRETVTLMAGLPRSAIDAARKKYSAKIRAKQRKREQS